ncbi:NAD(P)-dependent oxidoreductase [Dactylosporangium sp. AC04546]|uniref:NAD-dependent epimerase/dehydratase family protein n=1 Tax=Dactylosporangium sp. AC04546 TaxID=2862460 RepID=UPI001EDD4FEA|nr:NAD(P)-dependent oxidoreductase [Dactylosporangium sp. AC04546]WVK81306.1 NAD(P)-dependent oxidoreductase [Dactylosporangium sp. AC04546]
MTERVLITGGAGFVGLHLARRLQRDGAAVTLLDDLSRGADDPALRRVLDDGATLARHDLTTPIPDALLPDPYDTVVHLAAVVGVAQALTRPAAVLRTNLLGTVHLADWCARRPPSVLLFSSTSEVGDGAARTGLAGFPVPEDVPWVLAEPGSPRTAYALGKMAGEHLLGHLGLPSRVRIARYHNVYGPRMGNRHVIPQLIGRIQGGEDPLGLPGADQTRSFCHVDDAVDATVAVLRHPDPGAVTVNIGNDREEIRIADLAGRLCALAGRSPRIDPRPAPQGSPDRRAPDLRRLRELTGYEPAVGLADGLRQTYAWYTR